MKFDQILCDMTKISYFGKPNSTLGSVVPLAMFFSYRKKIHNKHALQKKHQTKVKKTNQFFRGKDALLSFLPFLGSAHLRYLLIDDRLFVTPEQVVSPPPGEFLEH